MKMERDRDWSNAAKDTKDCCPHQKLRKRHGTESSLELSERAGTSQHLACGLLVSKTVKEEMSVMLSHPSMWCSVTAALEPNTGKLIHSCK